MKGGTDITYIWKTNQLIRAFHGKEINSEVNIHAKRGIYRLLGQNGACKNNHYEDDYEFNVDFLSSVEMIAVWWVWNIKQPPIQYE